MRNPKYKCTCAECGTEFRASWPTQKFCGWDCRDKARTNRHISVSFLREPVEKAAKAVGMEPAEWVRTVIQRAAGAA